MNRKAWHRQVKALEEFGDTRGSGLLLAVVILAAAVVVLVQTEATIVSENNISSAV